MGEGRKDFDTQERMDEEVKDVSFLDKMRRQSIGKLTSTALILCFLPSSVLAAAQLMLCWFQLHQANWPE